MTKPWMGLLAATGLSACGGPPVVVPKVEPYSTVDVVLTTDMVAPKDVDSVRVEWLAPGAPWTRLHELGPAGLRLPALVGGFSTVTPPDRTVEVRITAWKGATPFTVSHALVDLPPEGSRVLLVSLSWLCAGTAREISPGVIVSTCPANQSCRAGACRPDDRRSEVLPAADDTTPPCFDLGACMAAAQPLTVDLPSCTVARPAGAAATNLAVARPPQTEGLCTDSGCLAPLDADPAEGWSDDGVRITLPAALCVALGDGRARAILASSACAPKTPRTPICGGT